MHQPGAGPAAQAPTTQQQRPPPPPLGPNQWRIDRNHSAASFSVRHNVVSTVSGQLGAIPGCSITTARTFGVLWNNMIEAMPVVGDEVTVTIDLEMNRPAMPGATSAQ